MVIGLRIVVIGLWLVAGKGWIVVIGAVVSFYWVKVSG